MENSEQVILATGGYDHTIKIWQTHTGICQRTLQHPESQINALQITSNLNSLAAASYQHIRMFDLASNTPTALVNYSCGLKNVTCLGFHDADQWMYSGSEDGSIRIWDIRCRNSFCVNSFDVAGGTPITCAKLHPNQIEMFFGDQNGTIHRWDMKTNSFDQYIPDGNNMILGLDISHDGGHLTAINRNGHCFVWKMKGGSDSDGVHMDPKKKLEAHSRQGLRCLYSPNSKLLITTSADQTARIWETRNYSLLHELKRDNQRWVWDAAFSEDSQHVFTASSDGVAKLWNANTGALEREYVGHQKSITSLAFRDVVI